MHIWEKEEMSYWERKHSFLGMIFPPSYRIFERKNFLFRWLKDDIRGKTVIEIGCYFPHEIILLLNPSKYKYTYVGVDVAKDALRAARKYLPEGMFVRCSVTRLPFKKESFDVILSLGVIHHLLGGTENIRQLSKSLKTGGVFALSEAVERKTLVSLGQLRRESASPHEGRLNPQMLIQACMESGEICVFTRTIRLCWVYFAR